MSHHSSQLSQAMRELMGEYPQGRLNAEDAGALAMSIGQEGGKVIMHFPKPVVWVGFTGDEAMEIAATLVKHARAVGLTKPATLVL